MHHRIVEDRGRTAIPKRQPDAPDGAWLARAWQWVRSLFAPKMH